MEISLEEKKAIEELKEFIQGPCEICKYCSGAYRLNRKNIKQLLNLIENLQKGNEELKNDMSNMYNEEVVISIMCDELNLSRSGALRILGGE